MPDHPSSADRTTAGITRWQVIAGIVGLTIFASVSLVHSLLRPDHALLTDGISALGAGSSGWVQGLAFAVSGLLMLASAVGVFRHFRAGWSGVVAAFLIGVFGIGVIGLAVFPATDAGGRYVTDRVLHNLSALTAFTGAALAPFALTRRFSGDPTWRPLIGWMLAAGAVLVVLHVGSLALVVPPGAPLHEWLGLSQWLFVAVWYPTMVVLGRVMLQDTQQSTERGRAHATASR